MHILTIHGIRRQTKWYEEFKKLKYWENTTVTVENFEYGYFTLFQFILPFYRKKVIGDFQDYYSRHYNPKNPPSLICHSFGTYIFYTSIKKYKNIKFDKVILCGSILKRNINWSPHFDDKQIRFLLNDFGRLDNVVLLSRLVISACGTSGKKGFKGIPVKYNKSIVQRENYYGHSDYFLPLAMEENWAKLFIPEKRHFTFKRKILRQEIIERIYKNICYDNIEYTNLSYSARIDDRGNYFANYIISGINRSSNDLNQYRIRTTADSTNACEEMWFSAQTREGANLDTSIEDDDMQNKLFIISFSESVKCNESFAIQYRFRWKETMNIKNGDTDHFVIQNAKECSLALNYKYPLIAPKLFIIQDKSIVDEITPEHKTELDKTTTYLTQYQNTGNNDGIIFYFEGSMIPKPAAKTKKIRFASNATKSHKTIQLEEVSISSCHQDQIQEIYNIETGIEFGNAATEITLKQRQAMFPDGFLVALKNEKVVGYIESVIWSDREFETFDEIKNFPQHYDINGDTLYIIFLAVKESNRKCGIGGRLIESIEKVARRYGLKRIKLVAKDDLIHYYQKFGFEQVRELPRFLEDKEYKSMLMLKSL